MSSPDASQLRSRNGTSNPTHSDTSEPRATTDVSPDLEPFEEICLMLKAVIDIDLNAPMAIFGLLTCTTRFSVIMLGWQEARGRGDTNWDSYIMLGGILMLMSGIRQLFLKHFLHAYVFTSGSALAECGTILVRSHNAYTAYTPESSHAAVISQIINFDGPLNFALVTFLLMSTVYCVARIRKNILFLLIALFIIPSYSCLAAASFAVAQGNTATALTFQQIGAGLLLAISFLGWYQFIASILSWIRFPYQLPLGDLSEYFGSYEGRMKRNGTVRQRSSPV